MKRKIIRITAAILILTMVLTGCGKKKSEEAQVKSSGMSVANNDKDDKTTDNSEETSTKTEMNTEENNAIKDNESDVSAEETTDEIMVEEDVIEETIDSTGGFNQTDEYLDKIKNDTDDSSYITPTGEDKETEAQKLAKEIVAKIITNDMSEFHKVKAINDYMILNVTYDMENYKNGTIPAESYTAVGAMKNKVAVCSGYARMFKILCETAGLEVTYVSGYATGHHAWNQVKVDGKWYNIDVTWNDPDAEYSEYGHSICGCYEYFLISDEYMNKSHTSYDETYQCNDNLDFKALLEGCPYLEKVEYCEKQSQIDEYVGKMLKNNEFSGEMFVNYTTDAEALIKDALENNNVYHGCNVKFNKKYTLGLSSKKIMYIVYTIQFYSTNENMTASDYLSAVATTYEEAQSALTQAFKEKEKYTTSTGTPYMFCVNEKLVMDKYVISMLQTWAYYDKNVLLEYYGAWEKKADNVYALNMFFAEATKEQVYETAYSTTEFEAMIKRMRDNNVSNLSISLYDNLSLLVGDDYNEKLINFRTTYCDELCKKYCLTACVNQYSSTDYINIKFTHSGHNTEWAQWKNYKEATCSEEGLNVKYCYICGEIAEEEIVPKNDKHTYYWDGNEETRTLKCEKCPYIGVTEVCMDGIWGYFDEAKALEYIEYINERRAATSTVIYDSQGKNPQCVTLPILVVDETLKNLAKRRVIGLIKTDFQELLDNEAYFSDYYYASNNYVQGSSGGENMYKYQYTKIGAVCFCVDRDDSGFNFLEKYVFELAE